MNLLTLSLAPVFIIAVYIYYRDKYEKEPIGLLLFTLLIGGVTVFPILFVEGFLHRFTPLFPGLLSPAWKAFAVAATTEEFFKFAALFLLIWKHREFNEKFDGIVYATYISLGFAGVENVLYVLGNGIETGIIRAVTAVPAHAIFGITMGFYFGLAKFYKKEQNTLLLKAVFYPILLHGIYDFILMTGINWLLILFFAFVVFLYIFGLKKVKNLSDQSIYKTDFDLLNKKFGQNGPE
jgi:RsiW-degrading membrane proteinase PrsW (M82 family)